MSDCEPDAAAGEDLKTISRMWGGSWGRFLFPGFWLVYLGQPINGVAKYSHGLGAVAGYVIVAVFAVCYLVALPASWSGHREVFWPVFCLSVALTFAELYFAHQDALVFCIYLAVLAVGSRARIAPLLVAGLTALVIFGPKIVTSWHAKLDWNDGLTVVLISIAMFGFFKIIQANILLAQARAEVARLAAENERSRIARDLHDLLGHSLTTITVKAGLARRLAARDPERAAIEIGEVERLSRRTLGEVRAAVSGYRDVTLAGELATSRALLTAAGIDAALPRAIDSVDADAVEPFGWVLREAVTNVVRHSRAAHCTVTVGPRWIEIVDDGRGGTAGAGNGLTGLRERLAAVGGTVEAGGCASGWRVRAELSAPSTEVANTPDAATMPAL